jgi:hypothetical protein
MRSGRRPPSSIAGADSLSQPWIIIMKTTTDWTQAVITFLDAQTAPTTIMKVAAALGTNADTLSADEYNS